MGVVYLARHIKMGREVAIKVLRGDLMTDPTMVERFEREAAIAARLSHRNLISVIDVGETASKQKLMVLELARGETGDDRGARTDPTWSRRRGDRAAARGTRARARCRPGASRSQARERDRRGRGARARGPEDRRLRCRSEDKRPTTAGIVLGTPAYMAPEHAQGHAVDPRCDLFALGVMVFEMLGGKLPFDGSGVDVALANVTQDPPLIAARTDVAVDPVLEAFVRRLMARRVCDRFQSARAGARRARAGRHASRCRRGDPAPRASTPRDAAASRHRARHAARVRRARSPRSRSSACSPASRSRARSKLRRLFAAVSASSPPSTPWHPWKSFGLIGGALVAAITSRRAVSSRP